MERLDISGRKACKLAGLSRSAFRRKPNRERVDDPDKALREKLRQWAKTHPCQGYRRAWADLRAEGWVVNRKKVQRLWREVVLESPGASPPEAPRDFYRPAGES
ncbi:MAG: IS3 family transposase [Mobiluncus sp.]|uniref:IS3 family transposase n=1 Tax=Mobiluncus sp. TaxID=47293 RepID=UPI00258BE9D0|nr:IS3 family transposase [Mobiluncus sp.]MCI6585207.1 IS3 family transposase [Mobiluncus sp.]